jgi:ketosteroid isomerase-like protein
MRRAFAPTVGLTLVLALASLGALAQQPSSGLQTDFDRLVATERAFAKLSEAQGIKASFLANVAGDAVIFRPGAVPAKEWLSSHPNPDVLLVWHPTYAAIARSGDLGWTTGPYELSAKGEKDFGQFSTVWRKQGDGTWKFVIDLGVSTPAAAPETGEPKLGSEAAGVPKDTATARGSLLAADRELGKAAAAKGLKAAYEAAVADGTVYLLRDGHQPFLGREAVRGFLATDPGSVSWEAQGSGVSAAGDLGYVYGTAERKAPRQIGVYLRVWQRPPGGAWKVVLDVVKLEAVH